MKKTIKSNPLKTFNDNKSLAVKKMDGAEASFKKSLPEAQLGGTLAGLKKLYKMYNTVSKASKAATIANKKNTKPKK
jgi:hypothetical protein